MLILLVVAAAALDGLVWRFRYPVDPAIAVLAAVGLFGPPALAWSLLARYRLRGGEQPDPGAASSSGTHATSNLEPGIIGDVSEGNADGSSAERGAGGRRVDGVVSR